MTTNNKNFRLVMFCLTLAFLAGTFHLAVLTASAQEKVGLLTASGTVTVNGKPAATGDIVAPGSEVQTAKGSSAVVSLGKLGRVEVQSSTTVKLTYIDMSTTHNTASFSVRLGDGIVKVTTGEGLGFFVDCFVQSGMTAARPSGRNGQQVFTVDSTCGNTVVSVEKGNVELRTKNGVKQIAAGGQDSAGQAKPGCTTSSTP